MFEAAAAVLQTAAFSYVICDPFKLNKFHLNLLVKIFKVVRVVSDSGF
jgi:hypothetical protein